MAATTLAKMMQWTFDHVAYTFVSTSWSVRKAFNVTPSMFLIFALISSMSYLGCILECISRQEYIPCHLYMRTFSSLFAWRLISCQKMSHLACMHLVHNENWAHICMIHFWTPLCRVDMILLLHWHCRYSYAMPSHSIDTYFIYNS